MKIRTVVDKVNKGNVRIVQKHFKDGMSRDVDDSILYEGNSHGVPYGYLGCDVYGIVAVENVIQIYINPTREGKMFCD